MGRKMKPGVRGLAYGCAVAAMLAFASSASAQTAFELPEIADIRAFAPMPVESRLSLSDLQVTPISTWKMSDADLDKLRLRASIAPKPIVSASSSSVTKTQKTVNSNLALKRTLAGIAGGVGGFFAGGYIGAMIEGDCTCDDPGLLGAVIGAPIGAAVGAIVGVLAVR
jgi:hypothetical protein